MDHCYNSLAWVANKLGEHDKRLRKDMIVSTGSMVACQFVPPGSTAVGRIEVRAAALEATHFPNTKCPGTVRPGVRESRGGHYKRSNSTQRRSQPVGTPHFCLGMLLSVEPISLRLVIALTAVATGIAIVNNPKSSPRRPR
jgi:hypothetical protein